MGSFTHFNEQGRAKMVDISDKDVTVRTAVAHSSIFVNPEIYTKITEGSFKKGDVLAVAQVAGIMAAKNLRLDSDVPSARSYGCGYFLSVGKRGRGIPAAY